MAKTPPIIAALALGASLLATGALAQSVAQPAYTHADLATWSGTPQTLIHMIRDIHKTEGGRVLEIRYTDKDGMPGFRAAVVHGGRVKFIRVAATSGDAVELTQTSLPDWMLRWKSRADIHMDKDAKVTLVQAIRTAETAGGGAAVAAGIAPSASNMASDVQAYNVLVASNGAVKRFAIDDRTGEVIADPSALSE